MDIFAKCGDCQRSYQVHDKAKGSLFRCYCGKVLEVPKTEAVPRNATTVVACSSCGAAKQDGAGLCNFCGSDFTIMEKDLVKLCPGCCTRLPSKAKFCFHCGNSVEAINVILAKDQADFKCPRCEKTSLSSRSIGAKDYPALECQLCAGLFIDHLTFSQVEKDVGEAKLTGQSPSGQEMQLHRHASEAYSESDVGP